MDGAAGNAIRGAAGADAAAGLAGIQITNCHVHLFTARHLPRHYPHRAVA